jgi:predicted nuclease of predicted toxin-antitoxin system
VKLLLDQNLSRRLLPALEMAFPGSSQTALLGLDTASDLDVWQVARNEGFTIVTKDADFIEMALIKGWPPKIIRLNLGNVGNDTIRACLLKHREAISEFLAAGRDGVLEID